MFADRLVGRLLHKAFSKGFFFYVCFKLVVLLPSVPAPVRVEKFQITRSYYTCKIRAWINAHVLSMLLGNLTASGLVAVWPRHVPPYHELHVTQ